MKTEVKQIIAKEWLFFILCLIIGLTVFPVILIYIFEGNLKYLSSFYEHLLSDIVAWIVIMIPYLLFQVIRLTIWAITILQINLLDSYPNLSKKIHNWLIPP